MKLRMLIFLMLFGSLSVLEAKVINIVVKDSETGKYIIPDKIKLVNNTTQEEYEITGGSVDFDMLTSVEVNYHESNENVYPNPGRDQMNFKMNILKNDKYLVQISDISGKVLFKENCWLQNGMNTLTFSTNSMPGGTYVLSVIDDSKIRSIPFQLDPSKTGKGNIEMISVQSDNLPVVLTSDTYSAKIYTSGYEVYSTEINPEEYADGEDIELTMNTFDFAQFSVVDLSLQMHFNRVHFRSETYDDDGRIVGEEDQTVEGNLTVKTSLSDSLHLVDSEVYFELSENDNKWKMRILKKFNGTGVIGFYPLDYFVEDDQIIAELGRNDFQQNVSFVNYKVESVYEDTGSRTTQYTTYSYGQSDIDYGYEGAPAILSIIIQ